MAPPVGVLVAPCAGAAPPREQRENHHAALQGRSDLGKAFDLAQQQIGETPSPLARAWLTIAMRLHGIQPPELTGPPPSDLMITAVEALAASDGHHDLMRTGAVA